MEKLAILGVGKSLKNFDWDSDYEVWGLNHHQDKFKRYDLWFDLHKKEKIEGIITQANFPFEEVYKLRRIPVEGRTIEKHRYFASSMSYMLAYAILKGYEEILLRDVTSTVQMKSVQNKEIAWNSGLHLRRDGE